VIEQPQNEQSSQPEAEAKPEVSDTSLLDTVEKEVEAEEAVTTEQAPVETEAAEAKAKKKKEAEEIVEEKTYTIPLGKALIMPPRKRSPRAMHMIRGYVVKHMKIPSRAEEEDEEPPTLTISQEVNEFIWARGIEKPPRKIRVRTTKDKDGNVTVLLAEGQ
jgi:large subunit ribosomal protein L31e